MKTFEQLAESAYAAAAKQQAITDAFAATHVKNSKPESWPTWPELDEVRKSCWIAAAKQMWAEFAAIH